MINKVEEIVLVRGIGLGTNYPQAEILTKKL